MLLGLILRGVSFEFREEAHHKGFWDLAFGGGSLLAALAQGFVLGGVLSGLTMAGDTYAGGVWDWLNPFTLLVSAGLVFGYLQLGATYLIIKTEGDVRQRRLPLCPGRRLVWLLAAGRGPGRSWALRRRTPFLARTWFAWPGALADHSPHLPAGRGGLHPAHPQPPETPGRPAPALRLEPGPPGPGLTFATAASRHPYVVPPDRHPGPRPPPPP